MQDFNPFSDDDAEDLQSMPPLTPEQYHDFAERHMEMHRERLKEAKNQGQAEVLHKREFFSSLSPEDLILLRRLFRACRLDKHAATYAISEINAILTYVHKVDLDTGQDPYDQLLAAPAADGEEG